jgi:hypothetical protein
MFVCATIVWLLHRQLLAEGNELLLSTVLALLAAAVCATHWLARPHLATQLLVVVFAWQLRWFQRGRTTTCRLLILLPLLTALWANLHGAFVIAFALIGIHWVGTVASWVGATADEKPAVRHRVMVLTALGAACLLATLLNPNGWRLPLRVVSYMSSPLLMGLAQEYLPPNFRDPTMLPFLLVCVLTLLMLVIVRPRLNATDALLLLAWFLLSLRMVRNCAAVCARGCADPRRTLEHAYLRAAPPSLAPPPLPRLFPRVMTSVDQMAGASGLPMLATIAMVLILAKPQLFGGPPLIRTELPAGRFPASAVQFLRHSPDAVSGEMFNEYAWGGYLILALPERKVFIHPNLDAYGEKLTRQFLQVNNIRPGWQDVLARYRVGWTILPRDHPLNQVLARRDDWNLVYTDPISSIYGRKQ